MNTRKKSYHTLRDFFLVIFKQKLVLTGFFALAVLSSFAVSFSMKPVYEASAKVLVRGPAETNPAVTGRDDGSTGSAARQQSVIDTAAEVLTGRYLAERVIQTCGAETLYPEARRFPSGLTAAQKALLAFQRDLSVAGGNIISVSFRHSSPELAARVVNTLIEEFLEYFRTVQKQFYQYGFFNEQVALMEKRLQASQKELGLFRNRHDISSIQKQKSLLLLQISDLEVERARADAEISRQESLASERTRAAAGGSSDTQRSLVALRSKAKKLQQQVTRYKLELARLNKSETRLRELERQVGLDEENYLLYAKKREEARIASAMNEQKLAGFSVIKPALPPILPVRPRRPLIIVTAVVAGGLIGLVLAFAAEYFSHTFDSREDIERTLGCAAIAAVPEGDTLERGLRTPAQVPPRILEECNRIRHYITRTLPGGNARACVFCGARAQEGVTSVLLHFARTLAGEGETVVLVDGNMRSPVLHARLDIDRAAGLADVLTGASALDEVIRQTAVPNLGLVTAGAPQDNPFALLQSPAFATLLSALRQKASWVLFDSPPVDFFDDACVLAPKADGVVLVLKAGKTRWEVAQSTQQRFAQCSANILGAVLNRQKRYIPQWLYRRL